MSAPADRKIGEPFNPWRRFNGVFVPLGLLAYPGLSDGAKLLYGRLGLYAGKDGACYAGRDTMAKDMGLHVATITRLLNELTQAGFIRRIRRGPGRPAICEFLYHEALNGCEKTPIDDAEVRDQSNSPDDAETRHQDRGMMSQECTSDDAKVRSLDDAKVRLPYKEEKIQVEKIHKQDSSSSSGNGENSAGNRDQTETPKTKKIPLSSDGPKPKTGEAAWYEIGDTMEKAAEIIRTSTNRERWSPLPSIEVPMMVAILRNMAGLDDLQLWLDTARGLHASAKSWGLLVKDSAQWPKRRGTTLAVVERAVPVAESSSGDFTEESTPIPHEAEHKPPAAYCCQFCGRAGVRQALHDACLWEWCICGFADALRLKHPGRVDEDNARVIKLRNRFNVDSASVGAA